LYKKKKNSKKFLNHFFRITGRTFFLSAENSVDAKKWVKKISLIFQNKKKRWTRYQLLTGEQAVQKNVHINFLLIILVLQLIAK
jgi:hypothetical protein